MFMLPISRRNKGENRGYRTLNYEIILAIVIAVIGSNALWGFIQFLVQRKDSKNDKYKEILDAIDALSKKVDKIDADSQEDKAVTARVRILKFMDELLEGRRHTKDSYDQCNTDITYYEHYCKEVNPNFKNNQTAATIEYINKDYQERLKNHDFL